MIDRVLRGAGGFEKESCRAYCHTSLPTATDLSRSNVETTTLSIVKLFGMPIPSPQPGDVVLIYSGNKSSFCSGFLQRALLDGGCFDKPWFSHAAIVLDSVFGYEACPKASISRSGCKLPAGVRLIPLADLIIDAPSVVILRHPAMPLSAAQAFEFDSPNIASLYGAAYSIFSLKKSAEERLPLLVKAIPDRFFFANVDPDAFTQMCLERPDVLENLKDYLPRELTARLGRDYFCSHLVVEVLLHAGLVEVGWDAPPSTPCGLYDLLKEKKWVEVQNTDYGEVIGNWISKPLIAQRTQYHLQSNLMELWRFIVTSRSIFSEWQDDPDEASETNLKILETFDRLAEKLQKDRQFVISLNKARKKGTQ